MAENTELKPATRHATPDTRHATRFPYRKK